MSSDSPGDPSPPALTPIQRWWRLAPWVALLVGLVLTVAFVYSRNRADDAARTHATEVARLEQDLMVLAERDELLAEAARLEVTMSGVAVMLGQVAPEVALGDFVAALPPDLRRTIDGLAIVGTHEVSLDGGKRLPVESDTTADTTIVRSVLAAHPANGLLRVGDDAVAIDGMSELFDRRPAGLTVLPDTVLGGEGPVTVVVQPVPEQTDLYVVAIASTDRFLGLDGGATLEAIDNRDLASVAIGTVVVDGDRGTVGVRLLNTAWKLELPVEATDVPAGMGVATWWTLIGGILATIGLVLAVQWLSGAAARSHQARVDLRRARAFLRHQSLHDELTGLPNRALLYDRLNHALARAARTGDRVGLLLLDLDGFQLVNDSLGHRSGDQVIAELADRLDAATRDEDSLARLGGDEFVVICERVEDSAGLGAVADRLRQAVNHPLVHGSEPIRLTTSVGMALSRGEADSSDSLLSEAKSALKAAKTAGRSQIEIFDPGADQPSDRLEIEQAVRRGVERDEFVVHFQPIVDLKTGAVRKLEALIRWPDPETGELRSPGEFLPAAEAAGLLDTLDLGTFHKVCSQLVEWSHDPRAADWSATVNFSPTAVLSPSFARNIATVLESTEVRPDRLVVEVTEGALLKDADLSIAAINALHELGVRVAIDDFGTGYSSLAYLHKFPIDILKIDRSFVAPLDEPGSSSAIVEAIIDIATRLDIELVAEGIETDSQGAKVHELGVPLGQGYFYCRPKPAEEIASDYLPELSSTLAT